MKTPDCDRYLEDPEANAGHLEECAECAALFSGNVPVIPRGITPSALPLAPWEGARHRSWSVVVIAAVVILGSACALFAAGGTSPLAGIASSVRSIVPSMDVAGALIFRVGPALQRVPAEWQLAIGAGFIIVNVLLFALLRRSPKGLDV